MARLDEIIRLFSSTSTLLPITTWKMLVLSNIKDGEKHTNGKLSGSRGLAWMRNSSLQLSRASKLLELFTS